MNRRAFCFVLLAMPSALSALPELAQAGDAQRPNMAVWDGAHEIHFVLNNSLDHPFYWWPRTLLSYRIEFQHPMDLNRLALVPADTQENVPIQFSAIESAGGQVRAATVHFFADLPAGARRKFVLKAAGRQPATPALVKETREGNSIVLDSGVTRFRIPASQPVHDAAPGPVMQVSRGGRWIGASTLEFFGEKIASISARRTANGPLFIRYELTYEGQRGSRYIAEIECAAGLEFVRFRENMDDLRTGVHGMLTSEWTHFAVTHRQAPNHPFPLPKHIAGYEDYTWERIDDRSPLQGEDSPERRLLARETATPDRWPILPGTVPESELPFSLGIYQPWTAFRIGTFANFWGERTNDALGIFIDRIGGWQDHEYACEVASPSLQVRYFYHQGRFIWKWPLVRGRRSTCLAFYDHVRDKEAMQELEKASQGVHYNGVKYRVGLNCTSHTLFLQNRYGTLDLNVVKDWVLDYPQSARQPDVLFTEGTVKNADTLERRIMDSDFVSTLPLFGTRQDGGSGDIPGKNIVNFGAVPTRQILKWWIDGFNRLRRKMSEQQRTRLTALFLLMGYVHAGEEYMPVIPMLSGHPNFLSDVKSVPPAMSFLFPDHPMASTWADLWQKSMELNARYNTRPAVAEWDSYAGRWTENLGTYVWAFLRPALHAEFLLRQYDGLGRLTTPQTAQLCDWLVHSLSAPFEGESEEALRIEEQLPQQGHAWGLLRAGQGPRRVYPPQGAHAERHLPPRSLWYLGNCLSRYAPLSAEHAMWASRPTDQDFETSLEAVDPWKVMYRGAGNMGTRPKLRSRKYTGYGIILRAGVGTPEELSVHLQQIDEGPNYRWGRTAEGGCGVLYFFAAGKAYGFNGQEDVGDRNDQDTDFSTNFGVYKDGQFRAIGQNVLSPPFYDLVVAQLAEIVARQAPLDYAAPEYVSRSVLLAGSDYFVLYDQVANPTIDHRLSWFVRRGDELPNIQLVRGASKANPRETQRTNVETAASTGVWFDGLGDSMAVVSHRKDLNVRPMSYGCRVQVDGGEDIVFRNPKPIGFDESGNSFHGTAGLIRIRPGRTEFALFHGTMIACNGFALETDDSDLGFAGSIARSEAPRGEYHAQRSAIVNLTLPEPAEKLIFYIDGKPQTIRRAAGTLSVTLESGHHSWELTDKLPIPIAPSIVRTENRAGGAKVIIATVAAASRYRLELSHDGGATWSHATVENSAEIVIDGLPDNHKVHLRAIALNDMFESEPGPDYPLYVSSDPPPPPDGLHVELSTGSAKITWGEVLGAAEYRLYGRRDGEPEFRLFYRGLLREWQDKSPSIRSANSVPGVVGSAAHVTAYFVTSVNKNGESLKSRLVGTDPASWLNWDPRPGEPFRRVHSFAPDSVPSADDWPHYYPR